MTGTSLAGTRGCTTARPATPRAVHNRWSLPETGYITSQPLVPENLTLRMDWPFLSSSWLKLRSITSRNIQHACTRSVVERTCEITTAGESDGLDCCVCSRIVRCSEAERPVGCGEMVGSGTRWHQTHGGAVPLLFIRLPSDAGERRAYKRVIIL
jgi:hypothetical protein